MQKYWDFLIIGHVLFSACFSYFSPIPIFSAQFFLHHASLHFVIFSANFLDFFLRNSVFFQPNFALFSFLFQANFVFANSAFGTKNVFHFDWKNTIFDILKSWKLRWKFDAFVKNLRPTFCSFALIMSLFKFVLPMMSMSPIFLQFCCSPNFFAKFSAFLRIVMNRIRHFDFGQFK